MNPELNKSEETEKSHKVRDAVIMGLILGGLGITAWQILDKSGDVQKIEPTNPNTEEIDQHHRQLSWNMHDETGKRWRQINKLIKEKELDAVALQEVSNEDFESLKQKMPDLYLTYVMADAKSKATEGGYGNVILSKRKPENVKSLSLTGSKFLSGVAHTISGFYQDVAYANTDLDETGKGFQADRSALAVTLPIRQGSELKDVRIVTGHIAGDERVHEKQLTDLLDFIKDQTSQNQPTIFCGDLNDDPENIIPKFARIGFITPETSGTWTGSSNRTIDYCSYMPGDVLGLGDVAVLSKPTTDHRPLIGSWTSR